jgi:hypothetical protein
MIIHSSENMKLLSGMLLVVVLYAAIVYLALIFAPTPVFITDDWREAQKFSRACNGYVTTVEVITRYGREYEMTCEDVYND